MNTAGKYFQRFKHLYLTQPLDDLGAVDPVWKEGKTYWGFLVPASAEETLAYQLRAQQLDAKITLKNNPPVKGGDKLIDQRDGTAYLIQGKPMWSRTDITVLVKSGAI